MLSSHGSYWFDLLYLGGYGCWGLTPRHMLSSKRDGEVGKDTYGNSVQEALDSSGTTTIIIWNLLEMQSLGTHPIPPDSAGLRVGPAICFLTSLQGFWFSLKFENNWTRRTNIWGVATFRIKDSHVLLKQKSHLLTPGWYTRGVRVVPIPVALGMGTSDWVQSQCSFKEWPGKHNWLIRVSQYDYTYLPPNEDLLFLIK